MVRKLVRKLWQVVRENYAPISIWDSARKKSPRVYVTGKDGG